MIPTRVGGRQAGRWNALICRDESMVGGEAGSTSQHFFHPAAEPVSPSYLPGWPGPPYALPISGSAAIRVSSSRQIRTSPRFEEFPVGRVQRR
jgi:hypothetical protein